MRRIEKQFWRDIPSLADLDCCCGSSGFLESVDVSLDTCFIGYVAAAAAVVVATTNRLKLAITADTILMGMIFRAACFSCCCWDTLSC